MTTLPISLDHVVIASSDLARSDDFYFRVFDAEIGTPREDFHFYRIGMQQLNVHGPGLAAAVGPSLVARIPVAPGGSDICFEWHGPIAAAARHLERCSVKIDSGPRATGGAKGAGTSVYFRDPDGSLLEFISYAPHGEPA